MYPSSTLCPFFLGGFLLKLTITKKGTLVIKGLLGNQDSNEDSDHRQEQHRNRHDLEDDATAISALTLADIEKLHDFLPGTAKFPR